MDKNKRFRIFKKSLSLIEESEYGFVIFTTFVDDKFIQFATNKNDSFRLDLPLLAPCQPSVEEVKNYLNLQKKPEEDYFFKNCTREEAVKLTEKYFRKVCNFDEDYIIEIERLVLDAERDKR